MARMRTPRSSRSNDVATIRAGRRPSCASAVPSVHGTRGRGPRSTAPDALRRIGDQARLIASLSEPALFGPDCASVTVLETHISYVLLTGTHAYKIKKDVDLGFLDFTSLAKRRHFCERELELNRRLAPALYLDVVPITGTVAAPVVGGTGAALEYAVRMREFPQEALASRLLSRRELGADDIDALAARVASFHAAIAVAGPDSAFGRPDRVLRDALQNFSQVRPLLATPAERLELNALAGWTEREHTTHLQAFSERHRGGFIRECHGDLHLGNIARIDGEMTIFDGIEFDEGMRWIDVASEVAFTVMDLQERGRTDLGHRFLNRYLEITGDYAGLPVLRFYLAYRAMVRAKVALLRAGQPGNDDAIRSARAEYRAYVDLARTYARPPRPAIVVTHGLSGSGKTTLTQSLLEALGAVRVRTDVERKRLTGQGTPEGPREGVDRGLYAPEMTDVTYRHVCALAGGVAAAGHVAIVDAACLKRWQRDLFRQEASRLQVPFVIVSFTASDATLRDRVTRRAAHGRDASDADLAVLEQQLRVREPLAPDERAHTVECDSEGALGEMLGTASWRSVVERVAAAIRNGADTDPSAATGRGRAVQPPESSTSDPPP